VRPPKVDEAVDVEVLGDGKDDGTDVLGDFL